MSDGGKVTPNDLLFEQARPLLEDTDRSIRSIAAEVGMDERSLRRHIASKAPQLSRGSSAAGDSSVSSSPTKGRVPTEEEVLREHDIDPEEVVVVGGRASRWGDPDDPNYQLRVNYEYPENLIQIPDPGNWEQPDLSLIEDFSQGLVVFRSDPHLPFNNEPLNRAVLKYLNVTGAGRVVFLGDLADHSMLSKHRTHPRFKTMVNNTNDAVARHIWETRQAVPNAQIDVIPGNHDARILYYVQDKAPELEGVRPGLLPEEASVPNNSLSFRELWRLDDLGVNLVDEDWKLASLAITPELTARHGYLTGNNSERKLLETHGRSQVHGHTHRGQVTYRTKHDPLDIRVVMDSGTEAQVEPDGLGYQPDPDWTPGIGVARVWSDGMFVVNFVPFINNYLLLPDGERISGAE